MRPWYVPQCRSAFCVQHIVRRVPTEQTDSIQEGGQSYWTGYKTAVEVRIPVSPNTGLSNENLRLTYVVRRRRTKV